MSYILKQISLPSLKASPTILCVIVGKVAVAGVGSLPQVNALIIRLSNSNPQLPDKDGIKLFITAMSSGGPSNADWVATTS
jgi:hypothetical protein